MMEEGGCQVTDMENLKQTVLERAHREGKEKLDKESKKIAAAFENNKATLLATKNEEKRQRLKKVNQRYQIELQQLKTKERQSTLVAKQTVLKALFTAALDQMIAFDQKQELAFMTSVLQHYTDQAITLELGQITADKFGPSDLEQLRDDFPQVVLSPVTISGQAGFLLKTGPLDYSYLYRDLIASIYQEECSLIAKTLFNEG